MATVVNTAQPSVVKTKYQDVGGKRQVQVTIRFDAKSFEHLLVNLDGVYLV